MDAEFQTEFVTADSLLYSVAHRPWLPPDSAWLLSQSWRDVLFAHFALEPAALRKLVPQELTLELYDNAAWLTLSVLRTHHLRPGGVPPLPVVSSFAQINLRTSVSRDGKAGLYTLSADAGNLSAVWFARVFFRLQYWHASVQVEGKATGLPRAGEKTIRVRSRRRHGPAARSGAAQFEAEYSPQGAPSAPASGSLEEFLAERYCLYSYGRGKLYRSELHHQPWLLQPAKARIATNTLGEPLSLQLPATPDLCHYSRCNKVLTWAPQLVARVR